jgi:hypothetical protein
LELLNERSYLSDHRDSEVVFVIVNDTYNLLHEMKILKLDQRLHLLLLILLVAPFTSYTPIQIHCLVLRIYVGRRSLEWR